MADQTACDTTLKVLLVGDAEVGKSSLIRAISGEQFQVSYSNTVGIDFKTIFYEINGQNVKIQIWDTAGQERFHTITKAYYRGAHGIILVYDLTSEESYLNVEKWVQGIREEGPSHVLLQLVGNKLDLAQSWRSVDTEKARMAAKRQQMSFYETSAKSGENVQDAFHNFVVELKDFYDRSMVALSTSDVEGEVIRLQTTSSARHCPC